MKKYFVLGFISLCFSCGYEKTDSVSTNQNDPSGAMSNGNDSSISSRTAWEQMRMMDPATGEIPEGIKSLERAFALTLPRNMSKAFTWDQRGPINKGGRTRAFALDVLNENNWLAAGVTGGIWRSTNAGTNWQKVTDQLQMHSITSLVQDVRPGKENIWYAGTGETYGIVSTSTFESQFSGNGILKSIDNGITWTELTSTQTNSPQTFVDNHQMDFVWRIVTDPNDLVNDVVLAAVYNGVFRSADGGNTWTEVLGFQQGSFSNLFSDYVDLVVTPSGTFYATISSDSPSKGVFRSDDGITWTSIIPPSFPTGYGRIAMSVNPQNENEVWYFGSTNSGVANGHSLFKYTYLSGDGAGANGIWDNKTANLPFESCYINEISFELGYLNTQSSFDVHIAVHPTDDSIIFIAGTSIWRSLDAFSTDTMNTWIGGYQCDDLPYDDINWQLSYPDHHPDQHYLSFLPSDPKILINVNDGGIYKTVDNTVDSVKWIPLNNGYVTTQFYAIAMVPGETTSDVVIGGMQDNGTWFTKTLEFDSAWVEVGGGDGMYCAITENAEFYIICTQNGKMFIKEIDADGNVIAHERIDPDTSPAITYNWANSLKLDPNNTNTLYWNGRSRIMRLDDLHDITINGDKTNKEPDFWVTIDEASINPGGGIITDIEMCPAGLNQLWYGSSQGHLYRLDDANSATPTRVNLTSTDFPASSWVSCVAVDPFDANNILLTFANYNIPSIFHSTDGGITWDDISGNLEENLDGTGSGPSVLWAENYPDGTLFVGTTVGLFTTTFADSANTVWTLEPGIGNVVINHMDYRTYDGKMIVGTHGNGVFSTNLTPAFVGMKPTSFMSELLVFPTLTNDQITISSEKAKRILIYDMNGKLMYDSVFTNGQMIVDVSTYPRGTYIVTALNGKEKIVEKFVKG